MTMTEITDEDIGKEGRFTWDGKWPAVVVYKLQGGVRLPYIVVIKRDDRSGESFDLASCLGLRLNRVPNRVADMKGEHD
jgi:hypothetical protein